MKAPVELLVCVTCRRSDGEAAGDGSNLQRPGAMLHGALTKADLPDHVTIRPVECLSNCTRGCSIVLRGGDRRWTYIYGNFREDEHVDTIVDGVRRYAETEDGLVPWRERPQHFRKNCISRIPPVESE